MRPHVLISWRSRTYAFIRPQCGMTPAVLALARHAKYLPSERTPSPATSIGVGTGNRSAGCQKGFWQHHTEDITDYRGAGIESTESSSPNSGRGAPINAQIYPGDGLSIV